MMESTAAAVTLSGMLDSMTFFLDADKLNSMLKSMNDVLCEYMPGSHVAFMVDSSPTQEFCGRAIALALFVPAHVDVEQLFESGVIVDDAFVVVRTMPDGTIHVIKNVLGATAVYRHVDDIRWKHDYRFEFKTCL